MTTNIDLAKQVASVVQMRSVTLARAVIESALDPVSPPRNIKISSRHRCWYKRDSIEAQDLIRVFAEFVLDASAVDEEKNPSEESQSAVSLEATFQLIYEVPVNQEFEAECLEQFAQVNGAYNAWPYWRELVQTATGRVGLSGVMVPVYRPQVRDMSEPSKAATQLEVSPRAARAKKA